VQPPHLPLLDAAGRAGARPSGRSGTGRGRDALSPTALDLGCSDGTLVVAEYGNNRVQRFARDGASLGTWGKAGRKPGQLAYPWAVEVGPNGQMYVLDSGNNRVQIVDPTAANTWQRSE
jgi:DNA-binding beta-propeller fold protein YncE